MHKGNKIRVNSQISPSEFSDKLHTRISQPSQGDGQPQNQSQNNVSHGHSFYAEKPQTSDINQGNNKQIRINKRLQRNGTTDKTQMRSSYYNKIKQASSILSDRQENQQIYVSSLEATEANQDISQNFRSNPNVPEFTSTIETPKRGRDKNGVIDLFSPKANKRRKNLSNNLHLGEGLNSMNGSIFSNDHPDYTESNNSQLRMEKSRNI